MADVVVTIPVSSVQYTTWLRTSYIGTSIVSDAGTPMVEQTELGVDQEDALINFLDEATKEVAKIFVSRQGDAAGTPFEYDGNDAIYRFNEETPVLPQASSLKLSLNEDTKNAIYCHVAFLWFKVKGHDKMCSYFAERYEKLVSNIDSILYKLHD